MQSADSYLIVVIAQSPLVGDCAFSSFKVVCCDFAVHALEI